MALKAREPIRVSLLGITSQFATIVKVEYAVTVRVGTMQIAIAIVLFCYARRADFSIRSLGSNQRVSKISRFIRIYLER